MSDFDPTPKLPPFPERSVSLEPGLSRYEPLMNVERMKSDYLFGIPLKSSLTKQEFSDDSIQRFIVRAISEVEHELLINISPVKYEDRYDYDLWDYQQFNFIHLNHWPVLQVESVKGKYPNSVDFIQYPNDWVSIYNEFGILQLTPTNGSLTQFFLTNDATYIPLLLGGRAKWPQLWQITYTSGFDNEKIPAVINELVGLKAALQILSIIQPVLFPFTSYGIGLDGTSQSVGGPGPMLFSERINHLKEEAARLMDVAKRYYNKKLQLGIL